MRHAEIDEPRLLDARDDLDRVTERFARTVEKRSLATRLAQRVGADHAHALGAHVAQPLAEAFQAAERPGDGLAVQAAVVVETGSQPNHLAQTIDDDELPVTVAGNDHVKAIGAEVDGREDVGDLFGGPGHALRSGGEGRAAAAGRRRVRVLDHELRAFEVFLVVDLGARQVLEAHRIDQQLDALVLDAGVVFFLVLVEREAVLEARAAAARRRTRAA